MYGADPLGQGSWRFQLDQAGYGVTSDLMSHSVDLAHMLIGPITRVTGTVETFIRERPSPAAGAGHYGRGRPEDPRTPVTNEDYAAMLCEFACGARGTFEASRTMVGPESENAFDVYGTRGAVGWNFERLNELRLYRKPVTGDRGSGYTTVLGGDRFGHHGVFVPGSGNAIGFEDLVTIEDLEFCSAVARGAAVRAGIRAGARVGDRPGRTPALGRGAGGRGSRCTPAEPPPGAPATPLAPLRIGVIGVGRIGRMHAELIARQVPGAALGAVFDAYGPLARDVANELGVPVATTVDAIFASELDAVAICSSSDTHVELLIAAAAVGQGGVLREAGVARPARSSIARSARSMRPRCPSRSASTAASTRRTPRSARR